MRRYQTRKEPSIAKPLLKDLVQRQHKDFKRVLNLASAGSSNSPIVGSTPLPSPDLYHDSGGGYNANLTFMQE